MAGFQVGLAERYPRRVGGIDQFGAPVDIRVDSDEYVVAVGADRDLRLPDFEAFRGSALVDGDGRNDIASAIAYDQATATRIRLILNLGCHIKTAFILAGGRIHRTPLFGITRDGPADVRPYDDTYFLDFVRGSPLRFEPNWVLDGVVAFEIGHSPILIILAACRPKHREQQCKYSESFHSLRIKG